jgi:Rhodopirellula transposase DDE domain
MDVPDTLELTPAVATLVQATLAALRGSARRLFMARVVRALGRGGQRQAERALGWNRHTVRKGLLELDHGLQCVDAVRARGRKPAEAHLPHLLPDIQALVDSQSQTDPQFKSTRLYTRLTASEVRRQLVAQYDYAEAALPSVSTIARKLNALGYHPSRVQKTQPKKRSPKPTPSLPRSTP